MFAMNKPLISSAPLYSVSEQHGWVRVRRRVSTRLLLSMVSKLGMPIDQRMVRLRNLVDVKGMIGGLDLKSVYRACAAKTGISSVHSSQAAFQNAALPLVPMPGQIGAHAQPLRKSCYRFSWAAYAGLHVAGVADQKSHWRIASKIFHKSSKPAP